MSSDLVKDGEEGYHLDKVARLPPRVQERALEAYMHSTLSFLVEAAYRLCTLQLLEGKTVYSGIFIPA